MIVGYLDCRQMNTSDFLMRAYHPFAMNVTTSSCPYHCDPNQHNVNLTPKIIGNCLAENRAEHDSRDAINAPKPKTGKLVGKQTKLRHRYNPNCGVVFETNKSILV